MSDHLLSLEGDGVLYNPPAVTTIRSEARPEVTLRAGSGSAATFPLIQLVGAVAHIETNAEVSARIVELYTTGGSGAWLDATNMATPSKTFLTSWGSGQSDVAISEIGTTQYAKRSLPINLYFTAATTIHMLWVNLKAGDSVYVELLWRGYRF